MTNPPMLWGVDKYRINGVPQSLAPVVVARPVNPKQERTRPRERRYPSPFIFRDTGVYIAGKEVA